MTPTPLLATALPAREWAEIATRAAREASRDTRVDALSRPLGTYADPPRDLQIRFRTTPARRPLPYPKHEV